MSRFYRSLFIVWVALRYGLDELVLTSFQKPWLRVVARIVSFGRRLDAPRGQRLREALERLGPIFVKFGQILSTRRDLVPPDVADELSQLQDRVKPFDGETARAIVEQALGMPVTEAFQSFDTTPLASASIAQVHAATLASGRLSFNWEPTAKDFIQLSGFWQGETLLAQGTREAGGMLNIGYRRKLTDKLSLNITGRDILNSFNNDTVYETPLFRDRNEQEIKLRAFYIGLTWTLGSGPRRQPEQFDFSTGPTGG